MTTMKRVVLSIGVLGLLTAALGGGTFATFSAQATNASTFVGGTVAMTNVAGAVVSGTNCSSETTSGTCAVIFDATAMKPGAADRTNTVTITYTGTLATGDFRLFATAYQSKAGSSSALCTAANPASKLGLQVKRGTAVIYPTSGSGYGTLDAFATTFTSNASGLQLAGAAGTPGVWATNDSATFTISVNLDATADDPYQGCRSVVTLAWYAAQ